MGLLEYLTAHAIDEDYAFVSERQRTASGEPSGAHASASPAPLVMAVFAVLVVTAAVQTSRNAGRRRARATRAGRPGRRRPAAGWTATATRLARCRREAAALQARQLARRRLRPGGARHHQPARHAGRHHAGARPRRTRRRRRRARRRQRPQPGARLRPAEAGQRAVGGGRRGDLDQRPAADQPEHDPARRRGDHRQLPLPAPALRRLRDRQPGHAAGAFRGNLERSGMVGPAARGRPAARRSPRRTRCGSPPRRPRSRYANQKAAGGAS